MHLFPHLCVLFPGDLRFSRRLRSINRKFLSAWTVPFVVTGENIPVDVYLGHFHHDWLWGIMATMAEQVRCAMMNFEGQ